MPDKRWLVLIQAQRLSSRSKLSAELIAAAEARRHEPPQLPRLPGD